MNTPPQTPDDQDPLGTALHLLRLTGCIYARSELTAPWGMDLPPLEGQMMFHIVTAGRCWLEADGMEPLCLERGSLALVPHGLGHRLVDERGGDSVDFFSLPIERITERYEYIRHGGGGAPCRLICVVVRFDHVAAEGVIDAMPSVLHLDAWNGGGDRWLPDTLRFIAREAESLQPGGETVITRLADILVIQMIRHWLISSPDLDSGWLTALRDPQLGRALAALHRAPEEPWTLATLAREASMSRSAFAARFQQVVGETPMQHVARWRLRLARRLLRDSEDSVARIAAQVGYGSEPSFCRAFKREFGLPPGRDRRASVSP